ncbi:MAG: S66 peptidase family protein [Bacillaceae bacterium]
MIPVKLKRGDEIRVIAPSRSMGILSEDTIQIACNRLEENGFRISFSKHCKEIDEFYSSSVEARVADLHEAFLDTNVKGILTVIGGFNSNQLLRHLDYELIRNNPKIICGYSDITALANAIYTKTGLVTYSGPHFSTFGMKHGFEYTQTYFDNCLLQQQPFDVAISTQWSDDVWYINQEEREYIPNDGYTILNEGKATGTIIGGNLCTLNLLQGTSYMPSLENSILFLEDDDLVGDLFPIEFDRNLQSLIHTDGFEGVKGIVIGRCQKVCEITKTKLEKIIHTKKELRYIPVIYGADFGHTSPMITFPIGGTAEITAENGVVAIKIVEH